MKLTLKRVSKQSTYTIGKLYINDVYFCDTLEDTDRGLISSMSKEEIAKLKIKGKTAIPTGEYSIDMNRTSPRFSKVRTYDRIEGKLPYLENVKGYEGILIHIGNSDKDTEGCILVGDNNKKGWISSSTVTFFKLYSILKEAFNKREKITITIE